MSYLKCNDYYPTHQDQLEYQWGGKYGRFNCTPCAAGMAGQAYTCGDLLYTGAQIRAASDEAIPDPDSPGLNLAQVDASLRKLSGGRIDLDVRYTYAFASYKKRLIAGEQAVLQGWRQKLVNAGQGYGNTFGKNHAIHTGCTNGVPWFDDPLTGRHNTTWATLQAFAGALNIGAVVQGKVIYRALGSGYVYAAFTRDNTRTYLLHFEGGAFYRYFLNASKTAIVRRAPVKVPASTKPAPVSAPRLYPWPGNKSRVLVHLEGGDYQGIWVAVPQSQLRLEEVP